VANDNQDRDEEYADLPGAPLSFAMFLTALAVVVAAVAVLWHLIAWLAS